MTAHAFQKIPTLPRARRGMPRISMCRDGGGGLAIIVSSTAEIVGGGGGVFGVGFSDSLAGWRSPVTAD